MAIMLKILRHILFKDFAKKNISSTFAVRFK